MPPLLNESETPNEVFFLQMIRCWPDFLASRWTSFRSKSFPWVPKVDWTYWRITSRSTWLVKIETMTVNLFTNIRWTDCC
jgi:hypothetical protein